MPDNSYGETIGALDKLRQEAKAKQQSTTKTVPKIGRVPMPGESIGLPQMVPGSKTVWTGNNPKEIAASERQYATLEKAAIKTRDKLLDVSEKYKKLLSDGIDVHDSEEASKLSEQAIRYRQQLRYFTDIAGDLGKEDAFIPFFNTSKRNQPAALMSDKSAAIAQGFRQGDIKQGE